MKKKDLPPPPVNRQRDRPSPPDRQRKHIVQRNEGKTTHNGMFYIHENVFPCHVFLCKFGSCTGVRMFHIHHEYRRAFVESPVQAGDREWSNEENSSFVDFTASRRTNGHLCVSDTQGNFLPLHGSPVPRSKAQEKCIVGLELTSDAPHVISA